MGVVEKAVSGMDVQAFHDPVSAKTDKAYIHVGKVLLRLNGVAGTRECEKDVSGGQGRDSEGCMERAGSLEHIVHFVYRFRCQAVIGRAGGFKHEIDWMDGINVFMEWKKMANVSVRFYSLPSLAIIGFGTCRVKQKRTIFP